MEMEYTSSGNCYPNPPEGEDYLTCENCQSEYLESESKAEDAQGFCRDQCEFEARQFNFI